MRNDLFDRLRGTSLRGAAVLFTTGLLLFLLVAIQSEDVMNGSPPIDASPPIRLEAFETYVRGFPLIVAVTCYNPTENRMFGNLPRFDLLASSGPVEFVFVSESTDQRIELPYASYEHLEPGQESGFALPPGAERRMLFDISELNPPLKAGRYRLIARYHRGGEYSEAEPVVLDVVDPSESDERIASLLRKYNDLLEASWVRFLRSNWRTIHTSTKRKVPDREFPRVLDASGLSDQGRRALSLHFFLHRAIYGPNKAAELNLKNIDAFDRGPLRSEAAVLRYEILHAREDSSEAEALRTRMLAEFPGVEWRVEEIRDGYGRISYLRRTRGAGRDFPEEPEFWPYVEPY